MTFEEMIRRIDPKIRAIVHKVNKRYSYCDADDFYQEALLYLWEKYQNGEVLEKTDSYLLQGCYFFLKNYLRGVRKKVDAGSVSMYEMVGDDGVTYEDLIGSPEGAGEGDSVEIFLLLDETEKKFTDKERDIFYLRLEGHTSREIGERFGISHVMVVKMEKKIRKKCGVIREELCRG